MRADGIYLFDSGKEAGLIKREEGMWTLGDGVQWVLELDSTCHYRSGRISA
jgi:hypothetical protein